MAVVGADALAVAVRGEFGGDGEGACPESFDGCSVAVDEVECGGVAAGEVVGGGAPVGAWAVTVTSMRAISGSTSMRASPRTVMRGATGVP
ncbi:hypothetical protein ACWEQ2_31040 [Streptomyces sp. NPDC004096]